MNLLPTVRTVTAYISLQSGDYLDSSSALNEKVSECVRLLRTAERQLIDAGYTVQTVRIATNPFGEWLVGNSEDGEVKKLDENDVSECQERLDVLNKILAEHDISFCSLGPAKNCDEIKKVVPLIVSVPKGRFSCSSDMSSGNLDMATATADTVVHISKLTGGPHLDGGLGNFRFCAACSCEPYIPFFPGASNVANSKNEDPSSIPFAVGLENGCVARELLAECGTISNIASTFRDGMARALLPIQDICKRVDSSNPKFKFVGIDSSLNPSLDAEGSVAVAVEQLLDGRTFGSPGTLGVAAEITKALQSLPDITTTGYCGLMLPVCEDARLAELSGSDGRELRVSDLLSISSVCGVGVDTVPLAGDCSVEALAGLILDVAGIAGRWNKRLSCRVFPVPGKQANGEDVTDFSDSPYMIDSRIFRLE